MFIFSDFVRDKIRLYLAVIFFVFGIAGIRKWWISRKQPLVRFLLIHHIKNPTEFERIIKVLVRDYNIVSFEDFCKKRFNKDKINILLTMDDGYASWYEKVLPLLEKYDVPVIFFISSGFANCANQKHNVELFCKKNLLLDWVSEPMNIGMLKEISNHPLVTIGGHTMSHPFLTLISADKAKKEIEEDKICIEQIIGKDIKIFAYPFGNFNSKISKLVSAVGYQYAVTTESDFCRVSNNNFYIPRSNHGTVSNFVLKIWLLGAFDIVYTLEKKLRLAIKRS